MSSETGTKIVSFISASGGVGKTKIALLFAYWLRRCARHSVLFIDLDPTAGASFSVFEDEQLNIFIDRRKTFSDMIKDWQSGKNVDFSKYKVTAEIGDTYLDFIIPGDELIDVIENYWKSGSAGAIFRRTMKEIIPFPKYHVIVIDTAPFFDPRYTTLSIYLSDYLVIPVTPSIVDMRRNIKMLHKIKNDIAVSLDLRRIDIDVSEFMRNNIICVLNKIPTNPNQAEAVFAAKLIEEYLMGKELEAKYSPQTAKKVESLMRYAKTLSSMTYFLPTYLKKNDAYIGRFPRDVQMSKVMELAESVVKQLYKKIMNQ